MLEGEIEGFWIDLVVKAAHIPSDGCSCGTEPCQTAIGVLEGHRDLDNPAAADPLQDLDHWPVLGSCEKPVSGFTAPMVHQEIDGGIIRMDR
jgi:hypothetical protein